MRSLLQYARESARWVMQNPILLALVIALVAYNQLSGTDDALRSVDWLHAAAVLTAAEALVGRFFHAMGIVSVLLGFLFAAWVSLFAIGVNFAVFAGKRNRLMVGLRKAFSRATLELWVVQVVATLLVGALFYGLAIIVVRSLGLDALDGSIALFIILVIGYPLHFMAMATVSTILAAEVSLLGKWHLVRTALAWPNLSRLIAFYVLRIGIEMVFLGSALLVSVYARLSPVWASVLITALVAIPFALVRTSGFLLTFRIFESDIWFRSYFRKFYEKESA